MRGRRGKTRAWVARGLEREGTCGAHEDQGVPVGFVSVRVDALLLAYLVGRVSLHPHVAEASPHDHAHLARQSEHRMDQGCR